MERTSKRWGERAPASWRPAPEAKPQGPKVAHCGGTGVCVVLGPFACSPLAPVCSNMAWPSLHCSAGTHQATQLWPNSPRKKTALCSSVWLSICPPSFSLLQIALVSCCKAFSQLLFATWSMFEVHSFLGMLCLSLFTWICVFVYVF